MICGCSRVSHSLHGFHWCRCFSTCETRAFLKLFVHPFCAVCSVIFLHIIGLAPLAAMLRAAILLWLPSLCRASRLFLQPRYSLRSICQKVVKDSNLLDKNGLLYYNSLISLAVLGVVSLLFLTSEITDSTSSGVSAKLYPSCSNKSALPH